MLPRRAGPPILCALAIALPAAPAVADSFAAFEVGAMLPVADEDYTNYVDSGLKLGGRVGSIGDQVGGMLSIDWSPVTEDYDGFNIFGFMQDVSTNRFRILVHALGEKKVGGKLHAGARVGFGVDITHVTFESSGPFGGNNEVSDTDTGIAVEVGGGLWFDVSDTLQIGGELALPMSFHADDNDDEIDLNDYVGIDLDILFGVRFLQH